MKIVLRWNFIVVCAGFILSARLFAADTNPISSSSAPSESIAPGAVKVTGYAQIQEQLRAAQMELQKIESNRLEMAASAQRSADAMAARIQSLEETIAASRAAEIAAIQRTQQITLLVAGAFGLMILAFVLVIVYLQWRAVTRLIELSAAQQSAFALGNGRPLPSLVGSAAVEDASARLSGAVNHLEKRILELEQAARASLAENPASATEHKNTASQTENDRDECIANLLSEGQSLLAANEPAKALECFEVALKLQPDHAETLVKKGGALEKLGQLDEAIACYDRAIAANHAFTIAYLQKGGLFNRMARYNEALECYEQALRTQEKKSPEEQVAA